MAYQALYRQWRPKTFSQMIGQTAVISTLKNQVVSDRIAHAYLFCGSRGTGKTSTAKILAKAINCEHPRDGDPCGECENWIRAEKEESLDIIEIDAASNNGVDEIRELRDTVKYPPQFGRYKVYIIDEVHMLSTSAFNALLKTLEEPPAHIVFILATTEPQKLPETILSRCQRFDFGRLSVSDIQRRLAEATEDCENRITPGALMMIARAAEGGMRDAFSILDMCLGYGQDVDENLVRAILGTSDRSFLFAFCGALADNDVSAALTKIDELIRDGKDPLVFTKDISSHIRTLLIVKSCGKKELFQLTDLTEEDLEDYQRQSEQFQVSRLLKIMDLFMSLETDLRYTSSPRIALETTALKCTLQTKEADVQTLNDRIQALEENIQKIQSEGVISGTPEKKKRVSEKAKSDESTPENPRPASVPAVDPENAKAVAAELSNRLKKREPSLTGFLMQGTWAGIENHALVWVPKDGPQAPIFVKALSQPEKQKVLNELLAEITGTDLVFRIADRKKDSQEPSREKQDEKYLNSLIDTFGREPVQVVETIEP